MTVDQDLIKRCREGNERAYYRLYKVCFSLLMSVCVRYHKNKEDAVAVLNVAFLKITQNLDKYHAEVPWDRWIKRIMINTIINEYRSNKNRKEHIVSTDMEESHHQFDQFEYDDINREIDAEHIRSFIYELPDKQQRVFNLYAIDGYGHKEIAELLEIPEGTSKWLLSQARTQLKSRIMTTLNLKRTMAS